MRGSLIHSRLISPALDGSLPSRASVRFAFLLT